MTMGKWSTYRKRGSAGRAPALGPPPAPTLRVTGGVVLQDATGLDDAGGLVRLEQSEDGISEWETWGSQPWDNPTEWGQQEEWEGSFVRAFETGNGIVYAGESAPSNILEL